MSDTAAPQTLPLLRRPDDRAWLGVCAAVGRATGTDPVLWRVCIGVLTVFGGTGLLLYAAGWLLIPEQGRDGTVLEARLRLPERSRPTVSALVLGAVVVVGLLTIDSDGVAPLAAVALMAFLILRRPEALAARPVPLPAQPTPYTDWHSSFGPAVPARPRRPRRPVFLLVTSCALLAVGLVLAVAATGLFDPTVGRLLAAALLVLALGQLATQRWGRSRALLALDVLLVAALGLTVAGGVDARLSAGERAWPVTASAERTLGAGDAVLDLRPLSATEPATVKADLGVGNLRIELPPGLRVQLLLRVGAGQVVLPDADQPVSGTHLVERHDYGPATGPVVTVQAKVGAGQLEVHRAAA